MARKVRLHEDMYGGLARGAPALAALCRWCLKKATATAAGELCYGLLHTGEEAVQAVLEIL